MGQLLVILREKIEIIKEIYVHYSIGNKTSEICALRAKKPVKN